MKSSGARQTYSHKYKTRVLITFQLSYKNDISKCSINIANVLFWGVLKKVVFFLVTPFKHFPNIVVMLLLMFSEHSETTKNYF